MKDLDFNPESAKEVEELLAIDIDATKKLLKRRDRVEDVIAEIIYILENEGFFNAGYQSLSSKFSLRQAVLKRILREIENRRPNLKFKIRKIINHNYPEKNVA